MKKLAKKVETTVETVEAYACICSCYCSSCGCGYPIGNATRRSYSSENSRDYSRESSRSR